MSYADIVASIALLVALTSLGWQIYTWSHQKRREEMPILKVVIKKRETKHDEKFSHAFNFDGFRRTFYIQNIGFYDIRILSCSIDSVPIETNSFIKDSNVIIGAKVGPGNSVSSPIDKFYGNSCNLLGKTVKIKCVLDSGKNFEKEYTLSEESD